MIWPRWLTGLLFVGGLLLLLALIAKLAGKLSDRFGETWVPPEQREEARRRKEEAARRAEPEPVPRERPAGPVPRERPAGPVSPEPYVTGAVYFVASLVVLMLLPRLTRWWDRRQHRAPVDPWDLA